ncbi:MAG: tRNA 2-thiouridine(34) synthase MnmA [Anaerolineales bacterium]|nr:tRNA 2-thiouridine(34) synthase MnmA [Anaerolineales bacterium]
MSKKLRVVAAMSGGVDSSVAAALLVEQGYEVIGLMMRLWGEPEADGGMHNRCCSPDSMAQARRVAEQLDIPFYAIDTQQTFKNKIVDFFIDGYVNGVTPNPCVECNREIRWEFLLNKALSLEADYLATGHYARVRVSSPPSGSLPKGGMGAVDEGENSVINSHQLLKAVDEHKDQSYVLSVMGQAQLKYALFPLGEYTKPQVRELARKFNLPVAERPESQDLCFLADGNYRRFLSQYGGEQIQTGPIIRTDGTVVGQHQGLPFYTIGQRKGIGVSGPEPLYVIGSRPAENALVVGTLNELGNDRLTVSRAHWVSGVTPSEPFQAEVKIRYKAPPVPATITPLPNQRAEVVFSQRLRDITPGQVAVFYEGEVVLGNGIIERETR